MLLGEHQPPRSSWSLGDDACDPPASRNGCRVTRSTRKDRRQPLVRIVSSSAMALPFAVALVLWLNGVNGMQGGFAVHELQRMGSTPKRRRMGYLGMRRGWTNRVMGPPSRQMGGTYPNSLEVVPHLQRRNLPTISQTRLHSSPLSSSGGGDAAAAKYYYASLLDWFRNIPGAYLGPVDILPSSIEGGGYGAFTTRDVEEGELLLTIPPEARMSLDRNVLTDPDIGESMEKLIDKAGPGGAIVALAGYLVKEWLLLEITGGSEGVGLERAAPCFHEPYLRTLPWVEGKNMQEHVLFWTEEDDLDLLLGSNALEDADGIREEVDFAKKVLRSIVVPAVKKYTSDEEEEDGGWSLPWQKKEIDLKMEGFDDAVRGAFVTLLSRSFQTSSGDEELRPILDMLNHRDETNVRHGTVTVEDEDGADSRVMVEVRARSALRSGEELFNQYQTGDRLTPQKYFTRFGFVPGKAESGRELLRAKDPLFFPEEPSRSEV